MTKLSSMKIPVYGLHLIPYHAIIILQNLYMFGAFMKSGAALSAMKAPNTLSAMANPIFL